MKIGLSALSFSYRCGITGRGSDRLIAEPMALSDLIALAERAGLQTIEVPLAWLPADPDELAALREQLARRRLQPVLDSEVLDLAQLAAELPRAAALGATVVRALVSPILEGARSQAPRPWEEYRDQAISVLRAVAPQATQLGITIAIENHQDATSHDLLAICEAVASPAVGVTFDPVNAITVAEDPFEAFQRLSHLIRCVHLSDYLVYNSPLGIRLVRCAIGEGDLSFRRLFELLGELAPETPCQIELFAHNARHIQWLNDEWWRGYGPRDIRELLPVLRRVAATVRPADDEWRTPWERGADAEAVIFHEEQQFASSVAHLRSLGILPRSHE